jgi:nodulation protein E
LKRVVVTGWGVVSPIGLTAHSYWSGLVAGRSGIGPISFAPNERLRQTVAAEIKDFDPLVHFTPDRLKLLDRVTQLAIVAAGEAIEMSGIALDDDLRPQTACIIGCGAGGQVTQDEVFRQFYEEKASRVPPLTIPKMMVSGPASLVSMHFGLEGPAYAVASACASATHAIGQAFQMLRSGTVRCAVAGGAEGGITLGSLKGWEAMRIMAPDTCRPFSKDRLGMVLGEGAAVVVLETLDDAAARGAEILGEIVGFGMSADARDLVSPDVGGMARAITAALADARLTPENVQYVNAHGTGTVANDIAETSALKRVFGEHARCLAVSSTKSMVGHALGAAGALEVVATLMALRTGVAPPTIGFREPDPLCDLDVVPNDARPVRMDAAISNSFAFGGLNAVLALRRYGG